MHSRTLFCQVVFGGYSSNYTVLNDLWTFELATATWRELTPANGGLNGVSFAGRARAAGSAHGESLIVTGGTLSNGTLRRDAAMLRIASGDCSSAEWSALPDMPHVDGVMDHSAVLYDERLNSTRNSTSNSSSDSLVAHIHGGVVLGQIPVADTYQLHVNSCSSAAWYKVESRPELPRPSRRGGHSALWLDNLGSILISLGGSWAAELVSYSFDQWAYDPLSHAWLPIRLTTFPDRRMHPMLAATRHSSNAVLYGGRFSTQNTNDHTWMFDVTQRRWSRSYPPLRPLERDAGSLVGVGASVVLFGGRNTLLQPLGDLWALDPGQPHPDWISLTDTVNTASLDGVPEARAMHAVGSYASSDGSMTMVVHGGLGIGAAGTTTRLLADVWLLEWPAADSPLQDGRWRRLQTTGAPSARAGHTSAVLEHRFSDPMLIIFGGTVGQDGDEPSVRAGPTLPARSEFGGALSNDLYFLNLVTGVWTRLSVEAGTIAPPPMVFARLLVLVDKQSHDHLALLGGTTTMPGDARQAVSDTIWLMESDGSSSSGPSGIMSVLSLPLPAHALGEWGGAAVVNASDTYTVLHMGGMAQYWSDGTAATSSLSMLTLGCPEGYYKFDQGSRADPDAHAGCKLCPLGQYSDSPGELDCELCTDGTYTKSKGATSVVQCDVCEPGWCGKGTCRVQVGDSDGDVGGKAICQCPAGWDGHRCQTNVLGAVAGGVAAAIFLAAVVYVAVRSTRRTLSSLRYDKLLRERLLEDNEHELRQLESVWAIAPTDVHLVRRIDGDSPGAQGEVCHWWNGREGLYALFSPFCPSSLEYLCLATGVSLSFLHLLRSVFLSLWCCVNLLPPLLLVLSFSLSLIVPYPHSIASPAFFLCYLLPPSFPLLYPPSPHSFNPLSSSLRSSLSPPPPAFSNLTRHQHTLFYSPGVAGRVARHAGRR